MPVSRRNIVRRGLMLLIVSLLAVSVASCSSRKDTPKKEVHLKGAGASFPNVLYQHWFKKFNELPDQVSVEYESVGSSEGVKRFLAGDDERIVDFGASDNGVTAAEAGKVKRGVVQVPLCGGMIAIVYNLPSVNQLKLSPDTYARIFTGEITKWNDDVIAKDNTGVELPDRKITVVVRQDGSGTTFHFTNHLKEIDAWKKKHGDKATRKVSWGSHVIQRPQNEGVGGMVVQTEGAVGYVDLGTALQNREKLKMAWLQNRAGKYIEPTPLAATLGLSHARNVSGDPVFIPNPPGERDYPIVGLTYVMLYKSGYETVKIEGIKTLFKWCLTEGQNDCESLGYVRLPPNVAAEVVEAVNRLGS